jgi:hypothetical protein
VRPLLISRLWVEERAAEWGEGSPLYISKVRGEFPESSDDGVIPYGLVRAAQLDPLALPHTPVELGLDVGAGGDETVIWERRGGHPGRPWRDHSADPMAVVGKIVRAIAETGASAVKSTRSASAGRSRAGYGSWASRGCIRLASSGSTSARRPRTRRAFPACATSYGGRRGASSSVPRGIDLSGVDDAVIAQLVAPRHTIDSSGRVKVEPKAETRLRLGRSPDDADALLLAFYVPAVHEPGLVTYYREEAARMRARRLGTQAP